MSVEVCKITIFKLIQEMLTFILFPGHVIIIVSSMNLWGFYFMFLSKISVAEMRLKKFNALCARWEMIITPASLTSTGVSKFSGWLVFLTPFAASAAWEAKSSTNRNAEYKNGSEHSLLLETRLAAHLWSLRRKE